MKCDVIVAGAGPAGAAAARVFAGSGLHTVVLEREYLPRPKACAGGVSAAALKLIGTPLPPGLTEASCSFVRGYFGSRAIHVKSKHDFMVLVSRERFDQWLVGLAQEAGAEVRQGEKVEGVEASAGGVTVRTGGGFYRGKVLIGADGVNSLVARGVRPPFTKRDLGFCICSDIPVAREFPGGGVEIYHGPTPMSYGWVFPKKETVSAGIGGWLCGIPGTVDAFRNFLRERGLPEKSRARGHHIPLGGLSHPTVADGVILAGDAAGFADPLTGEGIRYAIASGQLAGRIAAPLIKAGVPLGRESLNSYEKLCYNMFGRELKASLYVARFFGLFPRVFQKLFFSRPEPFQKLLEVIAGDSDYRGVIRWLLLNGPRLLYRSDGAGTGPETV